MAYVIEKILLFTSFVEHAEHHVDAGVGRAVIDEDVFKFIEGLFEKRPYTPFDVFLDVVDGDYDEDFGGLHIIHVQK